MSRNRDRARQGRLPARLPGQRASTGTIPPEALEKRPGFKADGLQTWEITAFFLGALCADDVDYGPKLILDHMQGDDGWWDDIDHVMGFSRMTAGLWSLLLMMQGRFGMPLHAPERSDPPTPEQLRELIRVREREVQRFVEGQGLSAKDQKLDPPFEAMVVDMARVKHEMGKIDQNLRRTPPKDPDALRSIGRELDRLSLDLCDAFFRMGAHSKKRREQRFVDEGGMGPEYDPCACGSGKLRGACHGVESEPEAAPAS